MSTVCGVNVRLQVCRRRCCHRAVNVVRSKTTLNGTWIRIEYHRVLAGAANHTQIRTSLKPLTLQPPPVNDTATGADLKILIKDICQTLSYAITLTSPAESVSVADAAAGDVSWQAWISFAPSTRESSDCRRIRRCTSAATCRRQFACRRRQSPSQRWCHRF